MNSRQNRNTNYRSGESRRGYQNGFNNRNGWPDRSRGQCEWRSNSRDRDSNDSRNGNRSESRQSGNQSTHMPGIPVNRNQSSTPFVSNEPKVDNCANGCGDHIPEQSVESLSNQLSQIDLKAKDTAVQTETSQNDTKPINDSSASELTSSSEVKTDTKLEPIIETNVVSNTVSNTPNAYQRRNTVGSVPEYRFQNYRNYHNRRNGNESNPVNGYKFERFTNFHNKMQTNDQNKRFNNNTNRGGFKKFGPIKNDLINNYIPINQMASNVCDTYPYSQCLVQNPFYSAYNYGIATQMMAPTANGGETNSEMASNRKQSEVDRSGKLAEQPTSTTATGTTNGVNSKLMYRLSGMSTPMTHFVKYEPSAAIPYPPIYYGNIVNYTAVNSENGELQNFYYFQSVIPPNIAPLPLDLDSSTGQPILPSNCYTYLPNFGTY